jgi:hypothetical protein
VECYKYFFLQIKKVPPIYIFNLQDQTGGGTFLIWRENIFFLFFPWTSHLRVLKEVRPLRVFKEARPLRVFKEARPDFGPFGTECCNLQRGNVASFF